MAKKKKARKKKQSARKRQPAPKPKQEKKPKKTKGTFLKSYKFWFWFVLPTVGFVAAIYTFYPRVSVLPGKTLDPYKAFANPFIVANNGYLAIKNVDVDLRAARVVDNNHNVLEDVGLYRFTQHIPRIGPGKQYNVFFNKNISDSPMGIREADIQIEVLFNPLPFWFPLRTERDFTFRVFRTRQGEYAWLEYHINKRLRWWGNTNSN